MEQALIQTKAKVQTKVQTKVQVQAQVKVQAKTQAKTKAKAQTEMQIQAQTETRIQTQDPTQDSTQNQAQDQAQTQTQPQIQTQTLEQLHLQGLYPIQSLYPFENKAEEQLFNKISKELRCTVCQNQSLFDSNAPIAIDLRREVYRQVRGGQREAKIIEFVVNRYGESILYNPPLQASTSFLWIGPLLMLMVGSCILLGNINIQFLNRKQ